jgi:hypothetical protein
MKIIINESQLKRLLEDRDTANLLFTEKNQLVNYFNERIGVNLFVNVIKVSSMNDLFIGETRNGASVFINQKGRPYFNFKEMSHLLRNSTTVAGYLNTLIYKKGTIQNYVPKIKHVVYIDNENCMAQVIDVQNHLLFVGLTTGEPLYNLTTKDTVNSIDDRDKFCVDIRNFRPDERIQKFAEELKGREVKSDEEKSDADNEKNKKIEYSNQRQLMNDVFKSIMNGLNKGITIKQIIDDYGVNLHDLRKYLSTSKIDAIFSKEERMKSLGIIKEERYSTPIELNNKRKELIFDLGFLLSLGLSKVSSYAIDSEGEKVLNDMMKTIRTKPILDDLPYFKVIEKLNELNTHDLIDLIERGIGQMNYVESRIMKYVKDTSLNDVDIKHAWLDRIRNLKERYISIL